MLAYFWTIDTHRQSRAVSMDIKEEDKTLIFHHSSVSKTHASCDLSLKWRPIQDSGCRLNNWCNNYRLLLFFIFFLNEC